MPNVKSKFDPIRNVVRFDSVYFSPHLLAHGLAVTLFAAFVSCNAILLYHLIRSISCS
jgi:hypothetical protein